MTGAFFRTFIAEHFIIFKTLQKSMSYTQKTGAMKYLGRDNWILPSGIIKRMLIKQAL
jgi:hypothetical protein